MFSIAENSTPMPPTASEVDDDQLLKEAAHVVLGKEVMVNNDEKGSGSGNASANGNGEESPCNNVNNLLERYAGFCIKFPCWLSKLYEHC